MKDAPQVTEEAASMWLEYLENGYKRCEDVYAEGLSLGIPKELARLIVPVGRYSTMRATGNIRGWLGFATLRSHSTAQEEIRVYSDAMLDASELHFPRTTGLFREFLRGP